MASYFDDYENDLNNFNEKYGTSFSFDAYASNQLSLENLANNFHSTKSAQERANTLYRGTLLNLYKEYVEKAMLAMLGKSDDEDSLLEDDVKSPSDFANDFEALMDIYRKYCTEKGITPPSEYDATKDGASLFEGMMAKVNEINGEGSGLIDKTEYVKQQYLAGKMPLDKMVGELDGLKSNLRPDSVSVGRLITYMRAIDQVRKERSFFAKLNPFNWPKMYAESRDFVAINNFVAEFNDKYPEDYVYAVQRADAKTSLNSFRESIHEAVEENISLQENIQEKNVANTFIKEAPAKLETMSDMMKLYNNKELSKSIESQVFNFADKYAIGRSNNLRFLYERTLKVEMENFWGAFENGKKALTDKSGPEPVEKVLNEVFNLNPGNLVGNLIAQKIVPVSYDHPDKIVKDYVGKMFKTAYEFIDGVADTKMSVTDKIVEAQKISNLLLDTYSPIKSDEKYAEYGDNYFVKNASLEEIQDIVGTENDIDKIMENVCRELGVEKTKVYLPDLSEKASAIDTSAKIDDKTISAPTMEAKQ